MCSGGGGSVSIENQSDEDLASYQAPVAQEAGLDEYGNMTYSFDENYTSEQNAYDQAQAEIDRRQQVRDQLAAQAAERENILKIQRDQAVEMEQQQTAIVTQQQEQAAQLQTQQAERVTGIRAAGNAVTQSLQILGRQGGKQAPTAATTASGPMIQNRTDSGITYSPLVMDELLELHHGNKCGDLLLDTLDAVASTFLHAVELTNLLFQRSNLIESYLQVRIRLSLLAHELGTLQCKDRRKHNVNN